MKIQRSIGTFGLLFAALGGIIGSGWLFGPFYAAQIAGPAAVISWIIGGALMMVVALTFAELASSFPMVGGTVRFLHLSHGPLVSYTMAWIGWLSSAAIAPVETMALLQYMANYAPWLIHVANGAKVLTLPGMLIASVIMLIMCVINAVGAKILAKTNSVVVILKLLIPMATALVLLSTHFSLANFTRMHFAPTGIQGILAALPLAGVIFSFIGYNPAIALAGEAKNPQRAIPFAILGGLAIGMVFYLILQIAFIGAISPLYLGVDWSSLSFSGDAGPFAGLMAGVGLMWWADVILVGATISPFGTGLIYTASTARMAYAMGENGYFPKFLMKLNRFGIPARIIVLNFVVGMLLFLPFPSWQKMVGFLVTSLVFAYAVGPLALLVLRKRIPNQPRPFRIPMPRILCPIAFCICNLIIYWTGWDIVSKMLIAIAIGYAVLSVYKRTEEGRKIVLQWNCAWWIFLYLFLIGLTSYLGTFGGGISVVPFGWDFIMIAIESVLIFELSQLSAPR